MADASKPIAPKPIALDAYEALAQAYSDIAETKAENGYNEHPAMRARIGSVAGLSVFEAGCGPGFLIRDLVKGGAHHVAGMDVSPTMIEIAKQRVGDGADLYVGDLANPLKASTHSVDLVVSSLALDYVKDWSAPLKEFHRILKQDGRLIFSVQHPLGSHAWLKPPSAFGVHYCEVSWKGFTDEPVIVPDHYRSFEEIINPVLAAGFTLNGVHETKPVEALRAIDPDKYHRGSTFPTFMIIEATRHM